MTTNGAAVATATAVEARDVLRLGSLVCLQSRGGGDHHHYTYGYHHQPCHPTTMDGARDVSQALGVSYLFFLFYKLY